MTNQNEPGQKEYGMSISCNFWADNYTDAIAQFRAWLLDNGATEGSVDVDGPDFRGAVDWDGEVLHEAGTYVWVELGEGRHGDYNPKDPHDEELLRLDYILDGEEVESACTHMPTSLTAEQREQALAMVKKFAAANRSLSPRRIVELFSWMDLEWLTDENLLHNTAIAMLPTTGVMPATGHRVCERCNAHIDEYAEGEVLCGACIDELAAEPARADDDTVRRVYGPDPLGVSVEIKLTGEGLIVDVFDAGDPEPLGTFAKTTQELVEWLVPNAPTEGQNTDYALPANVVAIRLYEDETPGEGLMWYLDGVDRDDNYTEACWKFPDEESAATALPDFCRSHGIALDLPVTPGYRRAQTADLAIVHRPEPVLRITVTRSSGHDGAIVVFLDGPFGEGENPTSVTERIRVLVNDAEVYADAAHGYEGDDPERHAGSVKFTVTAENIAYT